MEQQNRNIPDSLIVNIVEKKISIHSIINAIGEPLSIQDTNFRIIFQNTAHRKLVGGDFTGEYCYKAYVHSDTVCQSCPIAMTFKNGAINITEKPGAVDKGILSVEITASPLKDNEGNIIAGIEVVRDLTSKKLAEKAIQEAQENQKKIDAELQKIQRLESLSLFAGNIAHEYNNILTAIIGNLALAKMYAKPGYEVYDVLTEAEKASQRATDLTTQLLSFAKGGSPVRRPVNIKDFFTEMISEISNNSTFDMFISDKIWDVEIDELQMHHALRSFFNLLNKQGYYISADNFLINDNTNLPLKSGKYVSLKILVKAAISENVIKSIVDPAISNDFNIDILDYNNIFQTIKRNMGHITCEQISINETQFNILLPATEDFTNVLDRKYSEFPLKKGKILVMDDEEIIRSVISRMLLQCGFESELATNGSEMLKLYIKAKNAGTPYIAVLLDLIIQNGMGGKEAIKHLMEFDPDAKVIVTSGYSNDPIMTNFKDYGFAGYLPKPYRIDALKNVLNEVLNSI